MDIVLIPSDDRQHCPGNPEQCDECDYFICCTNVNGLCGSALRRIGHAQ